MDYREGVCVIENDMPNIFEWDHPVIRRGGVFSFSLNDESLLGNLEDAEKIRIHMTVNERSMDDNEILYNQEERAKYQWNLKFVSEPDNKTVFHLETPCVCEIGEYIVEVMCEEQRVGNVTFLMLFNAWNPDDDVYMPNENERDEYILSTRTILFVGQSTSMYKQPWNLDQFSRPTIELLLNLLKRMDRSLRSNFDIFARELTALVNSIGDNGVLMGRWDGEYEDGKPPYYWSGSKAIIQKYLKHNKPVKYGQCFTFAALLCSLFRLAGFGCRVISCFQCLHDTDDTLDKEVYYNEDDKFIPNASNDSIWNFHCWTECYMRCRENGKYTGWHVCDATPQEPSLDGRYVCGPAPVSAVKSGDLEVGYDCRYVFSEVNGDVVYKKVADGKMEILGVDISKIGHKISTKAVGSNNRNDVTNEYKYKDGTLLDVMARKSADNSYYNYISRHKIAAFRTTNRKDHMFMNEDLDLKIDLLSSTNSSVEVMVKCFVLQQPNIRSEEVASKKFNVFSNGRNEISFRVDREDILREIYSDLSAVLIELFIADGDRLSRQDFSLPIKSPSFSITTMSPEERHLKVSERQQICVRMENPFFADLQNMYVRLEMEFSDEKHKKFIRNVSQGEPIEAVFDVTPNRTGCFEVRAIIYGYKTPTFIEVKSMNII